MTIMTKPSLFHQFSVGNLKWSIDYYEANTKECDERLQTPDDFNEIPLLNSENLDLYKDGDLVRYQGMVQDMLNPEYYYPSYSLRDTNSGELTEKSGKYRDMAPCKVRTKHTSAYFQNNRSTGQTVHVKRLIYACLYRLRMFFR